MAESLLVRKGGGGLKILENIKQFVVAPGQTIQAGQLVSFVPDNKYEQITEKGDTNLTPGFASFAISQLRQISENKIVLFYKDTSSKGRVVIIEYQNGELLYGNIFQVETNNIQNLMVEVIDDKRLLVVYRLDSGNVISGKIITYSGRTISSITSATNIANGNFNFHQHNKVAKIKRSLDFVDWLFSTNQKHAYTFIMAFTNANNSNRPSAIAFTVTETDTFTIHSPIQLATTQDFSVFIEEVNDTSALVYYRQDSNNNNIQLHLVRLNRFGSLTLLNSSSFSEAGQIDEIKALKIETGRIAFYYRHSPEPIQTYLRYIKCQDEISVEAKGTMYPNAYTGIVGMEQATTNAALFVWNNSTLGANTLSTSIHSMLGVNSFIKTTDVTTNLTFNPNGRFRMIRLNYYTFLAIIGADQTRKIILIEDKLRVANKNEGLVIGLAAKNGTAGQTIDVYVNE